MRIFYFKSENGAAKGAGRKLGKMLQKNINKPILLMLSGGSAFKILGFVPSETFSPNLTITALDERFSFKKNANNFSRLKRLYFYKKAKSAGAEFIDTRPYKRESLASFTRRFENLIRGWKSSSPAGKIIITQGMGPDGHTAGIMPYPKSPRLFSKLFKNKKRWIVGYDAGKKNIYPKRVTTSIFFLKNIVDESVAYITGMEKAEALGRLKAKNGSSAETPARVMREMKKASIFTNL